MSAEARCPVSDLPAYSCAHCTGRDGGEQAEREARERALAAPGVVRARWSGQCADCGTRYGAGDPIKHADGYGWVGVCCFAGGTP